MRALVSLGVPVRALLLTDVIAVAPRVNVSLVEPSGRVTRFLEPGPEIAASEWRRVEAAVVREGSRSRLVVLAGSLPPGAPQDAYARIIHQLNRRGVRAALDSSGGPLLRGVSARPWVVKPNEAEAAVFLGGSRLGSAAVRDVLRRIRRRGAVEALVSLGERGLAGAGSDEAWLAAAPRRKGMSVGCGDAALAGFCAWRLAGKSFPEALSFAAACGAANIGAVVPGQWPRRRAAALAADVVLKSC